MADVYLMLITKSREASFIVLSSSGVPGYYSKEELYD